MAKRVHGGGMGMRTRKKTFVAKTEAVEPAKDYKMKMNPETGRLTRVVNNISVLKANVDSTDPTGGGVAGRAALTLANGTTVYLALYNEP